MKIIIIFGTRPEAIKLAPLIIKLKDHTEFQTVICSTGQHKEMLKDIFDIFSISIDYNLAVMAENQSIEELSSKILLEVRKVLMIEKPNLVVVHGDTTTTFNSALASFYQHIPIAHIEAGLRSFNLSEPFPEEANRKMISSIASYHFAPTQKNKQNLKNENISEDKIYVTGNTVIDALNLVFDENYHFSNPHLEVMSQKKFILFTCHRRENWGNRMKEIFKAMKEIAKTHEISIVYPVHKNPIIRELAESEFRNNPQVTLVEPLNYVDFIHLMHKALLIVSDSGGIQEEAISLNKRVILLRTTTERQEALNQSVILGGIDSESIIQCVERALDEPTTSVNINPFGDGLASNRIEQILTQILKGSDKK